MTLDAALDYSIGMLAQRSPHPALRPFVKTLWALDERTPGPPAAGARERMMPAATMHIVFRLSEAPVRIFDGVADPVGHPLGHAVVGGARSSAYVRDIARPATVVGAELQPGMAGVLLGAPAHELAETHTPLGDLWGAAVTATRERLLEAEGLQEQIDVLEAVLRARLPPIRGLHPAVAMALGRFTTAPSVRAVVAESGYSHRRFVALFRSAVGLGPKVFTRLVRFQRVLEAVTANPGASLADVAFAAGYSDQPHLNREFGEFAGISPGQYRAAAPAQPRHVPIV